MAAPLALFGTLGMTELLVIGGIIVLLFGSRKLPELGTGLGKFVKNIKAGVSEKDDPVAKDPKADQLPTPKQ